MSFSSDIKQELNKRNNLINKELVKFELVGYLISINLSIQDNKFVKFSTESDYNINRFSKLLSNLNIEHDIEITGKVFNIKVKTKDIEQIDIIKKENNVFHIKEGQDFYKNYTEKDLEKCKAIIRGCFLGAGSVNNPENSYHLEIVLSDKINMDFLKKLLEKFNINTKELITKNRYSIYLKDGEEISNFLALIGANKAVMLFEDIRVKKEMRSKVNRLVNCESANLNKTINASIEQIESIRKLQKAGKFNDLSESLKEIAELRLENPDMALSELGKLLKTPIGKSGVNYRLKKIMEIANEI